MKLIDRSPGLFICAAFAVVYGVIGVEAWMWTAASVAAVAGTLTLIIAVALAIGTAFYKLLDDGTDAQPVPAATPEPVERPQAVRVPAARPARPAPRVPAGLGV
ncbi:hypothetical protein [Conexibacter sp. SYSU D00693]|uniref:hypothetical protein n=1 Tax=Conexibacter sp. SYSU D00693 TaxID=2812560 RepID=UPI00196B7AE3|nr:hypothetical protein [Conexibacter sp. SYSU D00693]